MDVKSFGEAAENRGIRKAINSEISRFSSRTDVVEAKSRTNVDLGKKTGKAVGNGVFGCRVCSEEAGSESTSF